MRVRTPAGRHWASSVLMLLSIVPGRVYNLVLKANTDAYLRFHRVFRGRGEAGTLRTVGGRARWRGIRETGGQPTRNLGTEMPCGPASRLRASVCPGVCPTGLTPGCQRGVRAPVLAVALLTTLRPWKQSECPPVGQWRWDTALRRTESYSASGKETCPSWRSGRI